MPRLSEVKEQLGIQNEIKKDFEIKALMPLEFGGENEVSYIDQDKYLENLKTSKVAAVLIRKEYIDSVPSHIEPLIVDNPHLAFAILSSYFCKSDFSNAESNEILGEVMNGAFIGADVSIGKGSIIMPGAVIGDRVTIGENCRIYPNVVIYRETKISNNVRIHAGSVIGSDGFGYAHTKTGEHIKIEHNGFVRIEENVEIGANVTIDRAVFGETIIKKGAKIDNLVQIGHNCVVGENTLLVSQVGLAGSTTTGRNVVMGGQAGTGGHLHIGDFVQVAGRGAVSKSLEPGSKWGGHPMMPLDEWMKFYVKLRKLVKQS